MSWNDNYDSRAPSSQSAADLANSFLNSVGQELNQGSTEYSAVPNEQLYTYDSTSYPESDRHRDGGYARDDGAGYYRSDDYYREEKYHRDDKYRRDDSYSRRHRESRDRDRDKDRDRDRYRDRSYDDRRRRGHSRERRERSRDRYYRSHRDDRDYRHSRRSSPRRRRSRSSSYSRRYDENIVPLHKRERKLNNWDQAPPGMEGMTAEQVKQTGLFPLPGQVVGTRTPQSFAPPSALMADGTRIRVTQGAAGPAAVNATLARQARRLYVGQIPYNVDEKTVEDFFNSTMQQMSLAEGKSVVAVQINHDKSYAFVEFQTPEQATAAMQFDGISFQGETLKIRRPKDYQPGGEYVDANAVPDTPNKIFIGGLPTYLTEDQVTELLKSFGELRAFNLVKDAATGQSKGFAFCEYADPSVTDLACEGLNNMELGDRKLVVQRASVGAKQGMDVPGGLYMNFTPMVVKDEDATKVLQLMNMVTPEELEDDEEYQDIWDDVGEECSKYGNIIDMKIPRPQSGKTVPGLGKIFVRYEAKEQALAALRALAGRKFADRTVVTSFIDEENYLADDF